MIKKFPFSKKVLAKGIFFCMSTLFVHHTSATSLVTSSSGNWGDSTAWSVLGVPAATDNITIDTGDTIVVSSDQTIHNVTVAAGGILSWSPGVTLTITGTFTVNGTVEMNDGNINLTLPGASFTLGGNASFTWQPGTNTVGGATLFTNGSENFASTSTLIIKKWYNYAVSLGSVVTGNFGNLTLNSPNTLNQVVEWNQNNTLQAHQVQGTLTIEQGWITLDKSGTISNTAIGNIVLSSVNSTFYGHNGTHGSSFAVTTNNVTNSGGNFYGLNDGNGNVTVTVNGNFVNTGNVKIINNSGVSNVSNGNAIFNVAGTFTQNTGDSRIIYNISTLNSGTFTASIANLVLNGGIFMGQTACHTAGGLSALSITNNFTINFSNAADKFRGASLSSIGATVNNVRLNMTIGGTLTISGIASAEFTSSASSGSENVTIGGNLQINGMTPSFNYGTVTASHNLTLAVTGNLGIAGGTTFLSHNGGTSSIDITGNVTVSSGTMSVKGDSGIASIAVRGTFTQSGGTIYLHNNTSVATTNPVTMNISRSFTQSGGTIIIDNNTSSTGATHVITFAGSNYTLSGNASITRALAGSGSVFGMLRFVRNGTINFSRNSNSHFIQQTKQVVDNGCTLNVIAGNIQVSSHANAGTDFFEIATGGTVNTSNGQFVSGALASNTGLQVDSGGTLKTGRTAGLYDGTSNACISASNNFNYYLDVNSVVEYNGTDNQVVTGTGTGLATTDNHKYGKLKINFAGTPNSEYTFLSTSNVFVRTQLDMANGELNLNGNTLTIESGNASAAIRTNGYVKSEQNAATNASILTWKDIKAGMHEFPFGYDASSYIPVYFTPTDGFGGSVSISTRATFTSDNTPYAITPPIDTARLVINDIDISGNKVIDRWWNISADGFTADVTLSYRGAENTLTPDHCCGPMGIIVWNGSGWDLPLGIGSGTTTSTGTVTALNVTSFRNIVVVSNSTPLPIELIEFNVKAEGNEVHINWAFASEINNDYFNVERSADGIHFESIEQVKGKGNTVMASHYEVIDKNPLEGTSYYRLKQTNFNGKIRHSEIKAVNFHRILNDALTVKDYGPNPFSTQFKVTYEVGKGGPVLFQLTGSDGRLIHTETVNAPGGFNTFDYTAKTILRADIYLLNIEYNGKTTSLKLIKK